jgi:hypothetical protein
VDQGRAPSWVVNNLDKIKLIERKIYNRHDLMENLKIALQFPSKIAPE